MQQITEQMDGTWRERTRAELPSDPRPGPRILLEEWIDVWVRLLDEIEPTTRAKYKYFIEGHILPEFQGRQLGSLNFEEIEAWEKAIPRGSAPGAARTPAQSPREHGLCWSPSLVMPCMPEGWSGIQRSGVRAAAAG